MHLRELKTKDSTHHLHSLGHSPPPLALGHFLPHSAGLSLSKGETKYRFLETIIYRMFLRMLDK